MKRKTKLRILEILCIISILITIFSLQRTYAKYFEKVDTTYQTHIKRWLIKVNEHNIHEEETLSEIMQPILNENEHMNNNILVPTRTGYFDMQLDYTYVDLEFEYEFSIEQLNEVKLTDFEIYGYEIIDGNETPTIVETKEIKGIINPETDLNSSGEKKKDIKILFRWNDNEDNLMDNATDTQFRGTAIQGAEEGELHTELKYKATLTFKQYIAPTE